jgi:hypothetical protein
LFYLVKMRGRRNVRWICFTNDILEEPRNENLEGEE